jgi:phosphatidylserine synthase
MNIKKETIRAFRFYGIPALATLALLVFWFYFRKEIPLWWIIAAAVILLGQYAIFSMKNPSQIMQGGAKKFHSSISKLRIFLLRFGKLFRKPLPK